MGTGPNDVKVGIFELRFMDSQLGPVKVTTQISRFLAKNGALQTSESRFDRLHHPVFGLKIDLLSSFLVTVTGPKSDQLKGSLGPVLQTPLENECLWLVLFGQAAL